MSERVYDIPKSFLNDKLVKQAIVYSAVYNNNFNDPKKKYILTSNTLHSHYKIFIPHERLKQNVQAIKQLIENNPSISAETVTAPRRQALLEKIHASHSMVDVHMSSSSSYTAQLAPSTKSESESQILSILKSIQSDQTLMKEQIARLTASSSQSSTTFDDFIDTCTSDDNTITGEEDEFNDEVTIVKSSTKSPVKPVTKSPAILNELNEEVATVEKSAPPKKSKSKSDIIEDSNDEEENDDNKSMKAPYTQTETVNKTTPKRKRAAKSPAKAPPKKNTKKTKPVEEDPENITQDDDENAATQKTAHVDDDEDD